MTGRSGTVRRPPEIVIVWPPAGGVTSLNVGIGGSLWVAGKGQGEPYRCVPAVSIGGGDPETSPQQKQVVVGFGADVEVFLPRILLVVIVALSCTSRARAEPSAAAKAPDPHLAAIDRDDAAAEAALAKGDVEAT